MKSIFVFVFSLCVVAVFVDAKGNCEEAQAKLDEIKRLVQSQEESTCNNLASAFKMTYNTPEGGSRSAISHSVERQHEELINRRDEDICHDQYHRLDLILRSINEKLVNEKRPNEDD